MTSLRPEDWRRVREVFEGALGQPAGRRRSFIAESCGGDESLSHQVMALLASHEHATDFLETPAATSFGEAVAPRNLEGQRIGPYQLMSPIGTGGMGDVYRALDTRLDRTVAIKVLQAHVAEDQPSRDRFEREARAVAALNHPHICALYDVGTHEGVDFLVMEFLDGDTLAARLAKGRFSISQALEIAIQIASALDRAHRSGIIHRDLKPRNIMLTSSGAKLLDFGLAKATVSPMIGASAGLQPSELTTPGTILGTLHYMAPEQLEGLNADARTDLFAFGCVLYEMVTGRKAFDARSSASLLTAIMALEPTPVRELQPGVPSGIEYIIGRCVAKNADDRWQTARDLLAELRRTAGQSAVTHVSPSSLPASKLRKPIALALAAAALIAIGGLAMRLVTRATPPSSATWLSILPPPGGFDLSPDPMISPDGRYVVFKAEDSARGSVLWLKEVGSPMSRPLPGTDGIVATTAPFWSPDSQSIGFFARGQLKRVSIDGGAPQALASAAESHGGTWTSSGQIIFDTGTRTLHSVPASGGAATPVIGTGPGQVRLFPHALPDGRHYLFTSRNVSDLGEGVYVASLDSPEVRRISDAWSRAAYASGYLLFGRQGALFAQPFDLSRLAVTGEPQRVADGLGIGCCSPLSFPFSASTTGTLTFWSGTSNPKTQVTWVDRSGARVSTAGEAGIHSGLALSPDGRRAAVERQNPIANNYDVWLLDLASAARAARFTLDGNATLPVWSPDSAKLLVMYRARGLVAMPVAGGGERQVVADPASKWPSDWSPDGRRVAYYDAREGFRMWTAAADGGSEPALYRQARFPLGMMRFFPGGGWVAYISEESGQFEVYVDSLPTAGNKIRVSTNGGSWPAWRRDGTELYYLAPDRTLMAVAIRSVSGSLTASPPVPLFAAPAVGTDWSRAQFAPNADGSRFLFNARVEDRTPVGLTVFTGWPALLRNR
jgi:serine/threonine protein kinase/Tol biopolymer transport system component